MKIEIVEVYGTDGAALYVNGKLVSDYFTCGEVRLVKALGFKKWKSRQLDQKWYNDTVNMPEKLSDCVFVKRFSSINL